MIKSNLPAALAAIDAKLDAAKHAIGTIVVNNVKLKIRDYGLIDTGRLLASITYAIEGDSVMIGTNVEYAVYVFLGTIYIMPRNALVDGLMDSKAEIVATFEAL